MAQLGWWVLPNSSMQLSQHDTHILPSPFDGNSSVEKAGYFAFGVSDHRNYALPAASSISLLEQIRMGISDIANLIVALASITAIFVGIGTYRSQNRQAQRLLGIQILRDFEDKFFRSENSRRLRYVVCDHYKRSGLEAEIPPEGWRLADELSSISFYINKGYVDVEAAWSILYFWIDTYWFLFKGYAEGLKTEYGGVDYLSDFREVHAILTRFGEDHRNLPSAAERHNETAIAQFLDDELAETSDSLAYVRPASASQSDADTSAPRDAAR